MVDVVKNNLVRDNKNKSIKMNGQKKKIDDKLSTCDPMIYQDVIKYFMEIPPEKSLKDQLIDISIMMKIPLKLSVTYTSHVKVEYKIGKHRASVIGDSESICQHECQKKMLFFLKRLFRYIEYSNLISDKLNGDGLVECHENDQIENPNENPDENTNVNNVNDLPVVSRDTNLISSVPRQNNKLPGHISWNEYVIQYNEASKGKNSVYPIPGKNGTPPVYVSWNDLATLYENNATANKECMQDNNKKCKNNGKNGTKKVFC